MARRLGGGRVDLKKMGLENTGEMWMGNYNETTLQPGDLGKSCGTFTVGNRDPKKCLEKRLNEVFERGI